MQGTQVQSLVRKDPTGPRAAKPERHSCGACAAEPGGQGPRHALQHLRPCPAAVPPGRAPRPCPEAVPCERKACSQPAGKLHLQQRPGAEMKEESEKGNKLTTACTSRLPQEVCVLPRGFLAPLYCLQFTMSSWGAERSSEESPVTQPWLLEPSQGARPCPHPAPSLEGKAALKEGFQASQLSPLHRSRAGRWLGGGPNPAECFYPSLEGICLFSQLTCLAGLRTTVGSVL